MVEHICAIIAQAFFRIHVQIDNQTSQIFCLTFQIVCKTIFNFKNATFDIIKATEI